MKRDLCKEQKSKRNEKNRKKSIEEEGGD